MPHAYDNTQAGHANTVADIVARLRNGSLTASAVISEALRHAHAVNGDLNAFTELYDADALAAAQALDDNMRGGEAPGPLAGVPVAVKDFTPLKGKRTTRGSLACRDAVGAFDPVYVQRLKAAGAIVIGKTNTPEFAFASFCHNRLFGATANPWNPRRTCGGSSGGSAVAVAAQCVPIAEGTDMGGSIRIPAAWCGVIGLKPSLGRIPMDILPSAYDTISHFGPLAATVADAWHFLRVAAGPDEADPFSLPRQTIAFDPDAEVKGLRVALSADLGFYRVEPDVVENLQHTADRLRDAGAIVEPVQLDWDASVYQAIVTHWSLYLAAFNGHLLETRRGELDPELVQEMESVQTLDAVSAKRIEFVRTRLWRDMQRLFSSHDVLLCPTVPSTAPALERRDSDYGGPDADGRVDSPDLTAPFNFVSQCPAISVPSGFGKDGLPTAVQFVGRRFDEATVLRVARAVERTTPLRRG